MAARPSCVWRSIVSGSEWNRDLMKHAMVMLKMHFSSTLSEGDEVGFEEVRHFPLPSGRARKPTWTGWIL